MSHKLYREVEKKTRKQKIVEAIVKTHRWLWAPVNDPDKINKTIPSGQGEYRPIRLIPRWIWYTMWVVFIITVFKELLL